MKNEKLSEQREQSQACLIFAEIPELRSPTRSLSRTIIAEGNEKWKIIRGL